LVSEADIERAIRRGYARADVAHGNTIGVGVVARNALADLRGSMRGWFPKSR
jgi:hypothetical protein